MPLFNREKLVNTCAESSQALVVDSKSVHILSKAYTDDGQKEVRIVLCTSERP